MNRISHETWQGLHDRERSWMIKHFCSNNAHPYRREKASKIVPAGDGEFMISGDGCDEYIPPKTVQYFRSSRVSRRIPARGKILLVNYTAIIFVCI